MRVGPVNIQFLARELLHLNPFRKFSHTCSRNLFKNKNPLYELDKSMTLQFETDKTHADETVHKYL